MPWSLAAGPSGEIGLVGIHSGGTPLGGNPLGSTGVPGTFLVLLDAAGNYLRGADVGDNDWPLALAFTPNGGSVLAGPLGGRLSLAGVNLTSSGRSAGNPDIVLARLAPTGEVLWSRQFGDGATQTIAAVAVDPLTSEVAIVGSFASSLALQHRGQ